MCWRTKCGLRRAKSRSSSTLVAQSAREFDSVVKLAKDCQQVEATEVMQILLLAAGQGDQLLIEATGHDARQAVEALAALFAANFDEDQERQEAEEAENRQ